MNWKESQKEAIVTWFKAFSRCLSEGTEGDPENPQNSWSSWRDFKPGHSEYESTIHSVATFSLRNSDLAILLVFQSRRMKLTKSTENMAEIRIVHEALVGRLHGICKLEHIFTNGRTILKWDLSKR
jgi:hypothetical protein